MSTTWRGWLQLPETPSTADWRAAAIAIQADTRESAIRISNGESQVLRLRRHALPAVAQPFKLRPGDEYLITGGTGAVGWHFARWLVSHGATRLVLTYRRGWEGDVPPVQTVTVDVTVTAAGG
jgi:NADPH:quinone reductase-like Zn-dependent oxidoreductase